MSRRGRRARHRPALRPGEPPRRGAGRRLLVIVAVAALVLLALATGTVVTAPVGPSGSPIP
jgi:ferric-dicitrate binding protein FerR (iron transport regulator)